MHTFIGVTMMPTDWEWQSTSNGIMPLPMDIYLQHQKNYAPGILSLQTKRRKGMWICMWVSESRTSLQQCVWGLIMPQCCDCWSSNHRWRRERGQWKWVVIESYKFSIIWINMIFPRLDALNQIGEKVFRGELDAEHSLIEVFLKYNEYLLRYMRKTDFHRVKGAAEEEVGVRTFSMLVGRVDSTYTPSFSLLPIFSTSFHNLSGLRHLAP